jgi:hypothetical protein
LQELGKYIVVYSSKGYFLYRFQREIPIGS